MSAIPPSLFGTVVSEQGPVLTARSPSTFGACRRRTAFTRWLSAPREN
jgi:hypothetical protein